MLPTFGVYLPEIGWSRRVLGISQRLGGTPRKDAPMLLSASFVLSREK